MLALKVWNELPEAKRLQIVSHIFPAALPEDIKLMAREFHHDFKYEGPDGNGNVVRSILSSIYASTGGLKVVIYV
jgi:hypothetical protein